MEILNGKIAEITEDRHQVPKERLSPVELWGDTKRKEER